MFKQSRNVVLRDFREEDIENKIRWINDPRNNAFLHYDLPLEAEKTRQWFLHKNNSLRQDCVIEYDGAPVGLIGLLDIDERNKKAEYYVCMGEPAYKRKGIARTATELILSYAFEDLGLKKVYLNVDALNEPACMLYESCGFACEGYFREDLLHNGKRIDRKRYAAFSDCFERRQGPSQGENVLILSAGTRNKIIQFFRRALSGRGRVVAADMSPLAPALYEADAWYTVPKMADPAYFDAIREICRKENIRGILSLIDPELSLLSAHQADFAALGVTVIGSSQELCEMSLDKYRMYRWLCEHGYRCARSWMDKEAFFAAVEAGEARYPVFLKPALGSASIAVSKAWDRETVELLFAHREGLMIQEYMAGQEIGADVYVDMISGEPVSIFTKKKLKMRAGETDKSVSFRDPKLFELIERFVREAGFRGPIDIDIFDENGDYVISEVNPRFGGGYPHAYECGCDHMHLIAENLSGRANERRIGGYEDGVFMMKYSETAFCRLPGQGETL